MTTHKPYYSPLKLLTIIFELNKSENWDGNSKTKLWEIWFVELLIDLDIKNKSLHCNYRHKNFHLYEEYADFVFKLHNVYRDNVLALTFLIFKVIFDELIDHSFFSTNQTTIKNVSAFRFDRIVFQDVFCCNYDLSSKKTKPLHWGIKCNRARFKRFGLFPWSCFWMEVFERFA